MQQITPIEIRQKSFEKRFRGYNPDEVDAFLHTLAYAWEKFVTQFAEVESALKANIKEVKRLQEIENALLTTVKSAEVTAHHITEQAKKAAELQARETKIETERMIHEAQEKIKTLEEDSQKKHQHLKAQMGLELAEIEKMIQEAKMYRDTLLQQIQHLAEDILAKSQLIGRDAQHNVDEDENKKEKKPDTVMTLSPDSEVAAVV